MRKKRKRGQVTTFMIIGIIILFIVAFLFVARKEIMEQVTKVTNPERYVRMQFDSLKEEIKDCVDKESRAALRTIGDNGGYFDPPHYLAWYGRKVTFLCKNIPETEQCLNTFFGEPDLEDRLSYALKERILTCADQVLIPYREETAYELYADPAEFEITTNINPMNVLFEIYWSIGIRRNELKFEEDTFKKSVAVPMGKILKAVKDISNMEAVGVDVDPFYLYDMVHMEDKYFIEKRRPYPHKVYIVSIVDYDYYFYFAVEGEE